MSLEQERKLFEAWVLAEYDEPLHALRKCNGKYDEGDIQDLWEGWQARARVSPWVSVNDSLPKGEDAVAQWSETVLAGTKKGSVVMAQRSLRDGRSPDWEIIWADTEDGDPFTHWMPLPEPPK